MGNRIFISYSHHDAVVANALCSAIEDTGAAVWIAPRDIEPSSEWAEQIIDGINAARIMLVVFSSWSNRSPQVRREVERAVNRDIPVIPFRIENVLPVKSLEYFLSTQHWFDAYDGELATHIPRLCRLVQALSERTVVNGTDAPAASLISTSLGAASDFTSSSATPLSTAGTSTSRAVLREEDLAFVTRELARHIGPIARYLVQRASTTAASPAAMIETLAAEFKEQKERSVFTTACRQRLGL
ncbi:MAG: toll/interleukin-1 receptor domain-containing protein [Burkholderiaceae bacterium]